MACRHDKIINMSAKKVLAPNGLFQKGTSRIWLDDNGYFMTFVAFDACNRAKGSYLGVGIDFLWEKTEGLNKTLAYSYGERGNIFCEYQGNDDVFQSKMEEYARTGLQKVMEYRRFKDMEYAKERLARTVSDTPRHQRFWDVYDMAMICFLKGDFEDGVNAFEDYLAILKESFYVGSFLIERHEKFYQYCMSHIYPYLTSKEAAQKMVLDMIRRRRDYFQSKPSFKKMNKDISGCLSGHCIS